METDRDMPRISEMLYVGLCSIIGTPTQVKIRRDVMDTMDMMHGSLEIYRGFREMVSGSYREGFRLRTSDRDMMSWFPGDIVICDSSQIPPSYHPTQTLILVECQDTPPGFAKLQLLTPTNNLFIRQSCVSMNDQVYISSSLYQEAIQSVYQSYPRYQSSTLHGPCTSGFFGDIEYDFAHCYSCKHWPPPAYHWIERCQKQKWPSAQVLRNIISDGCHLVAIGSGGSTSRQQCETEWRMSFSQAEYKLVSSMNHSQFLCYGAMKIFLKEVLNVGFENPLLCSYFMKTTLFWKVQENKISVWSSKNILHCVWMCFKYLTQCVYRGEFPNFFIPQNNMFIKKIHGAAQKQLFLKLFTLYNMGFSCLLLSPSLYRILTNVILNPHLQVSTVENNIISEIELDREFYKEIRGKCTAHPIGHLDEPLMYVKGSDNLYKTISTSFENHIAALHVMRNSSLVRYAFCLDINMDNTDNFSPLSMLISAAESGFISDALYVAMYFYNKNRYTDALYYIDRTKQKLSQPYIFDIATENVNREMYMEAVGGKSWMDKIRKAVSFFIMIDQICCIDEMKLEVYVKQQSGERFICIIPLVMTHMLSFLCHHHLGDRLKSRQSLHDFRTLLHYDEGQCVDILYRYISWQMLGICEQIDGDKEKALYSYQKSYIQYPYQKINSASVIRIQNIVSK